MYKSNEDGTGIDCDWSCNFSQFFCKWVENWQQWSHLTNIFHLRKLFFLFLLFFTCKILLGTAKMGPNRIPPVDGSIPSILHRWYPLQNHDWSNNRIVQLRRSKKKKIIKLNKNFKKKKTVLCQCLAFADECKLFFTISKSKTWKNWTSWSTFWWFCCCVWRLLTNAWRRSQSGNDFRIHGGSNAAGHSLIKVIKDDILFGDSR